MDSIKRIKKALVCLSTVSVLTYTPHALAYIGPGLGMGFVLALLGIVFGLLMLVVGVIWYPVKRLIRRFRSRK